MTIKNRSVSLFLAVVMILSLAVSSAAAIPDFTKTGEIKILLTDMDDDVVKGGTLTLYKVADIKVVDGNYAYVLNDDFAGSGESLDDIGSASLAERLADYADDNRFTCVTKTIGSDGRVSFDDLELGLYLLVQYEAAYGYYKLNPFLVSVPQVDGEEYVYEVDASPKVEADDKPTPPPPPPESEPDESEPETEPDETETEPEESEPDTETEPDETEPEPEETETEPDESEPDTEPDETEPEEPDEPELPQTGQLKWPIPILIVGGLSFFLVGWVLRFRKKDSNEE